MATWRQCAEYYLKELWCPDDRRLVRAFSATEVTCDVLHDLCCRYGVVRTIPGRVEEVGVDKKYGPLAKMLNSNRAKAMAREDVAEIIDREVINMRKEYGRNLWSAISKAFWMMKQHPVVIFDKFAWQGLQRLRLAPGYKTYREYFDSWFRFFEQADTKRGLDDALEFLPSSPCVQDLLLTGDLDASELSRLTDSVWFRNRVTDIRLCCEGGADWLSKKKC